MFGFKRTTKPTRKPVGLAVQELDRRDVPAVIIADDPQYQVNAGSVLTVPNSLGVLINDFNDTNPNYILQANQTSAAKVINGASTKALPSNFLSFQPNGGFTVIAPSDFNEVYGNGIVQFRYRARDVTTGEISATEGVVTITITSTSTGSIFATGSGAGSPPRVRVYDSGTGLLKFDFLAYEENFTGGVRVATGDLTGDGIDDIATAPARGGGPRVKVFDGSSGVLLEDFFAVDSNFRGGAYVAIGDIDGARKVGAVNRIRNDLIVGAGEGGGPRVTVYNGFFINTQPIGTGGASTFSTSVLADFFAYDLKSRAGVQVAAGNVSGITDVNTRDFIVTAPGVGGGPHIRVFDGRKVDRQVPNPVPSDNFSQNPFPISEQSFFAFNPNSRSGVSVAVGQFRGTQQADIVVGTGDGTPVVRIFDGSTGTQLREFTVPAADAPSGGIAGASGNGSSAAVNFGSASTGGGLVSTAVPGQERGGARVAVTDRNGDGLSDIVVGLGAGSAPRVRIFDGNTFTELDSFIAYPANFLGGVFVGGNSL